MRTTCGLRSWKYSFVAVVLFFFAACGFSQTVAVTATVIDNDSQTWNNGNWVAIMFSPNGPPTIHSVPLTSAQQFARGNMSSSGVLTASLIGNDVTDQGGDYWQFTVCPNAAVTACNNVNVMITGTSIDISTAIHAGISSPRFMAGDGAFGYTIDELSPTPTPGAWYYNVNLGAVCQLNLAGWVCSSGTPGATGPTGAAGAVGATGAAGADGATGSAGVAGSAGANGSTGATGATGLTGGTGASGVSPVFSNTVGVTTLSAGASATASIGGTSSAPILSLGIPQGAVGATGATGLTGGAGASGATGATGQTGVTGTAGTNGAAGATGATGGTGSAGTNGAAGATGATGATGIVPIYNTAGLVTGIKCFRDSVMSTATTGAFAFNYTSAGFTAVPNIQLNAAATGTTSGGQNAANYQTSAASSTGVSGVVNSATTLALLGPTTVVQAASTLVSIWACGP